MNKYITLFCFVFVFVGSPQNCSDHHLCLILSHLTLVHTLAPCLLKILLSVIFSSVSGGGGSPPPQIFCTHFSSSQVTLHADLAQLECIAMVLNCELLLV